MSKNVAIIDHIGMKGGNHYYGLMLLGALNRLGYSTWFFSNFEREHESIHIEQTYPFELKKNAGGLLSLLGGTLKAVRACRKNNIRHVIFHLFDSGWINVLVMALIRLFGCKIVSIAHDISSFEKSSESPLARRLIYRVLSNKVVVHNRFSYRLVKAILPPKVVERVAVIKHGGHLDVIKQQPREAALKQLGLDPAHKYMLFFGQIKKVKGLDLFLKAVRGTHPDYKLIIAGKPWKDDFSQYEAIIQEEGIDKDVIRMVRYITEEERDALYSCASLLVLPYRKIYQSGVLLMSMSFGLPVVVADLPPLQEVITDGENGLLFASGNAESLRQSLIRLTNDEDLQEQLGKRALDTIRNDYGWDDIASKYVSFFES